MYLVVGCCGRASGIFFIVVGWPEGPLSRVKLERRRRDILTRVKSEEKSEDELHPIPLASSSAETSCPPSKAPNVQLSNSNVFVPHAGRAIRAHRNALRPPSENSGVVDSPRTGGHSFQYWAWRRPMEAIVAPRRRSLCRGTAASWEAIAKGRIVAASHGSDRSGVRRRRLLRVCPLSPPLARLLFALNLFSLHGFL